MYMFFSTISYRFIQNEIKKNSKKTVNFFDWKYLKSKSFQNTKRKFFAK